MKYVLMFTSRPDLDADDDPEAAQAIYKRVYEWFQENAGVMADAGAELLGVDTATTVKHGADGAVVVDGPFNEAKEVIGGFSDHRRRRHGRRDRGGQDLAVLDLPGTRSRSGRWSRTTRTWSDAARPDGRSPRAHPARGGRSVGGPALAPVPRLRPGRGGGAVAPSSRRSSRGGATGRPTTRRLAAGGGAAQRSRRRTPQRAAADSAQRATGRRAVRGPTTGWRCCSPAATPRSRPRPGWRSPCVRSSA